MDHVMIVTSHFKATKIPGTRYHLLAKESLNGFQGTDKSNGCLDIWLQRNICIIICMLLSAELTQ